ncbi:replication initiation protein RepM [Acinetobacter pollinis]|uniref:replication initiation protein RepM n=1 Tax=Acinetobacter pollinis TaxID=2605270 RepID=UPI0018A334E7|nr:replication initiation protein RepM [Acinetobacter pollinis]MBF7699353.1 replication initiation protein [Acinetobacter pollinis]
MESELVVKDNALINASYSLSLVEQRLILLATVSVRENVHKMNLDCLDSKPIMISASDYINTFHVDPSVAYKSLKEACKTLFARQFSYQENVGGRIANMTSRWVQKIGYIDNSATVVFTFADDVLPLITELQKHFTSYEIKQTAYLSSGYAVRLYELLIAWRSSGKTPQIKLEDFRAKMGVLKHEYQRMGQFKEKVLHIALEQINKHTDIKATYEQHREGRSIVGFSFKFKQKQVKKPIEHKKDQNTPDFFTNMTDKQRHFFASKLSEMPEMSKYSQGTESYDCFAKRIADMLLIPEKFRELYPMLEKVGFNA